jgi:hypothetical protein
MKFALQICDIVFGFDIGIILYCVSYCSSDENKKPKIDVDSRIALFVQDPDLYCDIGWVLWIRIE